RTGRGYLAPRVAQAGHLARGGGRLALAARAWTPARRPSAAVRARLAWRPAQPRLPRSPAPCTTPPTARHGRPTPTLTLSAQPPPPGAYTSPPAACPNCNMTYPGPMPMRLATGSPPTRTPPTSDAHLPSLQKLALFDTQIAADRVQILGVSLIVCFSPCSAACSSRARRPLPIARGLRMPRLPLGRH